LALGLNDSFAGGRLALRLRPKRVRGKLLHPYPLTRRNLALGLNDSFAGGRLALRLRPKRVRGNYCIHTLLLVLLFLLMLGFSKISV